MPPSRRLISSSWVLTFVTIVLILSFYFRDQYLTITKDRTLQILEPNPLRSLSPQGITKATIAYEPSNSILNRSLILHEQQNERFSYKMHVLRSSIVRGYANTLLWVQHVIVGEMIKDQGVEWILFFTPTVVVSNPNIPLQTFLPPLMSSDWEMFKTLTFIGTKPNDIDMSSDLLWIRVCASSLRMLNLAMTTVNMEPGRDWGEDIVASSLQYVLQMDEYRDKVVWHPKGWYNGTGAVFQQPWGSGVRNLLAMEETMRKQALGRETREVYPNAEEAERYWDTILEAKRVLSVAKDRGHTSEEGEFAQGVKILKGCVELRSWDISSMRWSMEQLKGQLGIGEIIGYEIGIG
jgi:hypothetical protein